MCFHFTNDLGIYSQRRKAERFKNSSDQQFDRNKNVDGAATSQKLNGFHYLFKCLMTHSELAVYYKFIRGFRSESTAKIDLNLLRFFAIKIYVIMNRISTFLMMS